VESHGFESRQTVSDAEDAQKERAIEVHSTQAGLFAARYREVDPYASCFNYSRRRLEVLLDRLLPPSGAGLRLLDVGCGTGHHLARAAARGFTVAGVDGSQEMIEQAARSCPGAELHRSDVEALPFSDGSFDVVLSIEVLRYLPDARDCIHEMARVTRAGGTCLATALPRFNLSGYPVLNRLAGALPFGNLVRLRQFFHTSRELHRLFRNAGFGQVATHGVYLGPINWVERLAPRALPSLLKRWEPLDARVADLPLVRDLSAMLLVHAIREP
jgi:ubiquinone/menaquinone biosynthesis C-methylase UbiE